MPSRFAVFVALLIAMTIQPLALGPVVVAQPPTELPSKNDPVAHADQTLKAMQMLFQQRKWKELIDTFGQEDFLAWPKEVEAKTVDALALRGQIYSFTKDGRRAETDLQAALKLAPRNTAVLLVLAENAINNMDDSKKAMDAYREVMSITGTGKGWQPLTATLGMVRMLTDNVQTDAALEVLKPYGDLSDLPASWRIRFLRAYGHLYAAQGREAESLSNFREALKLEAQP